MRMMGVHSRRFLLGCCAVTLVTGGFIAGFVAGRGERVGVAAEVGESNASVTNRSAVPETAMDFQQFWDTWSLVQRDYLRQPIADRTLFYGALTGLVASIGDPYSAYFDPDRAQAFRQDLAGELEGIGAEIGIKQKQLTVIAPLPGSPAERAGLRTGDAILAINEKGTAEMALEEAVAQIRGPRGTTVELLIVSRGGQTSRKVRIERAVIHVESVRQKSVPLPDGRTAALVTIAHFNEDTAVRFDAAVREVIAEKRAGIILDLRNNPGGFMETAIDVASAWLDHRIVVRERKRDGAVVEHESNGLARLQAIPTVVLVNEGSASAAEILAGALQDYGAATIIGAQTFGKGTVQHLTNLADGSAVKITIAEWLTPKGRSIEKDGITPDVLVKIMDEDVENGRDPQMERALQILNERITHDANDAN